MKKVKIIKFVLMITLFVSQAVFGAPVDFDNMNVASRGFGFAGYEGRPNLLAAYKNKIYFILSQDGSENPSKVYCYDPFDGLSNTANHSIIAESTGQFFALERLDELLYFADTLGRVFVYDGIALNELTGTPFSSSDFVTSFEKFNGLVYYGTSKSNIFRYNGVTYEQVYAPTDRQRISDMVAWQKDGRLYVSIGPVTWCCPNTAYSIRSNSGDANSWETVLQNIYYVSNFTPVSDYLYLTVTDSSGGYQSSVRKSSDGISFPKIHQSNGQYKTFGGSLFFDGMAYFFTNQWGGGYGYKIIAENGTVSLVPNQSWTVTHAVVLNDEIYALAAAEPYDNYGSLSPSDVYLITTAQGPPPDIDGDRVRDEDDNCPSVINPDQVDDDGDGIGNACDNCPEVANPGQENGDGDGIGSACDNCPLDDNQDQLDADSDGVGDVCDICLGDDNVDDDSDGMCNASDNCPSVPNPGQEDFEGDGVGDACDNCPGEVNSDQANTDGDNFGDVCDNCHSIFNNDQADNDQDGDGDLCDSDDDNDMVDDILDNCQFVANADQADFDGNGIGDACDNDDDGDGVLDTADSCQGTALGSTVDASGCSGAQNVDIACPCNTEPPWKNHGAYVSCVAHAAENQVEVGLINETEKDAIVSERAKSGCGKKK